MPELRVLPEVIANTDTGRLACVHPSVWLSFLMMGAASLFLGDLRAKAVKELV